ncbi:V4R domain-containing protein [Hydrogenivirga sp.]
MRDIEKYLSIDRPRLGDTIPLTIFRAFRHFSANYVEDLMGERGSTTVFYNAGRTLGLEVGEILNEKELDAYLDRVIGFVEDQKIGLLVPVQVDENGMVFQLEECITCAGMPDIGKRICHFETGFVAGVVEHFLGHRVVAKETKCNAKGEGVCEVSVETRNAKGK